jgi:hypothetical protein
MRAKKRPLRRTYKRSTGPLPVLRPSGGAAKPESKASEIKKGSGLLSDASRAVILRLVETVKGL